MSNSSIQQNPRVLTNPNLILTKISLHQSYRHKALSSNPRIHNLLSEKPTYQEGASLTKTIARTDPSPNSMTKSKHISEWNSRKDELPSPLCVISNNTSHSKIQREPCRKRNLINQNSFHP